jgi:glycosyltransferase involved in cell wall biosynthesis
MSGLRVALVVQRYGTEVNGGAELLCRQVAERLVRRHEVEVLTTCAVDYITWRNHYPSGVQSVNGVPVRRFAVERERKISEFGRLSGWIFSHPHTPDDELEWVKQQGPCAFELLAFLESRRAAYDAFVFFTYLYLPTCLGLPIVADRAALVPTAHDELPIYLNIYDRIFRSARFLVYSTEEEQEFAERRFRLDGSNSELVGVGIDAPDPAVHVGEETAVSTPNGAGGRQIAYMGRIDESKGCAEMFDYFLRYVRERPESKLQLLLMGKPVMQVPRHPSIVHAGFVPEAEKNRAIAASRLILMPSPHESLSLALLEAWAAKRAVVVNGRCKVLRGQCLRSNGGLWYTNYAEFRECLDRLLTDDRLCAALGEQGYAFVVSRYSWTRVEQQYERILSQIARTSRPMNLS